MPTTAIALNSNGFSALGLSDALLRMLEQEKYHTPTPIQTQTIPALLSGRDVLGSASTGTGKTAAFALPIIQRLAAEGIAARRPNWPRALVLAPTRELAVQIAESFATYGRGTGLRTAVIFGGVGQGPQVRAMQAGVDVVVATPGRLMDLMEQKHVHLGSVQLFVLDEADRMLDMGFIQPIRKIASLVGSKRQTMLFSATMPKEIKHLADALLSDPVRVMVTPVPSAMPKIEQRLHQVSKELKQPLLEKLLEDDSMTSVVVFTKTKHGADRVMRRLERSGASAQAIHGNKNQNQRQRALDGFKAGTVRILVATDVAARGIDVDGVSHVINYDLPIEPESYVHRIGRTGRAGATGVAIAFCDPSERGALKSIERLIGKPIPVVATPTGLVPAAAHAADGARGGHRRGDTSHRTARGTPQRTARSKPAPQEHLVSASERAGRPARAPHPVHTTHPAKRSHPAHTSVPVHSTHPSGAPAKHGARMHGMHAPAGNRGGGGRGRR